MHAEHTDAMEMRATAQQSPDRVSIARVIEPRVATVIGPPGTPVGGLISVSV